MAIRQLPTVSISVAPGAVVEDGPANLTYTLTRDLTSGPLSVSFDVAGTAELNTDYTQSGASISGQMGTVEFFDGASTATVTIDPTPDTDPEKSETVVLTLTGNGEAYVVGMPATATGSIDNDDLLVLFGKVFDPPTIGPGSVTTLTLTIDNTANPNPATGLAFTDNLPAGVTIADPAQASTDCQEAVLDAPAGGGTITFSNGRIGAGQSCSISVDVTSSTLGTHTNTTSMLTSTDADSDPATDDLMVVATLPGFNKRFSPSRVSLGGRSTLTFTIDNTANTMRVGNLDFTDQLPVGMVIASPSNAVTNCVSAGFFDTTLTARSGTSVITLDANGAAFAAGFEVLPAGATCTVSVDVIATGAGMLDSVSGELLVDNTTSAGRSSDTLEATVTTIALDKDFVNDPVPPGDTVTVDFIVMNRDRNFAAMDVSFTDDLAAGLTGLTFDSLLFNNCGGSVTGVGTTDFALTGGSVRAGASCTISASLRVPSVAAPGVYNNVTGAVAGTIDGNPVEGNSASDDLFVAPVPIFTKEFLDADTLAPDPVVNAGDDVVMRFTITNTSMTSGATDIAFLDELTTFLPFPVTADLPPNACGGSVSLLTPGGDRQQLSLTGGTLDAAPGPGASCTFDVTLTMPDDMPPGAYLNTTEEITATIDGATVTGPIASDDFTVIAAPSLRKSFIDDPLPPGGTVTLEFTLAYPEEASGDATDISFTDDLAALSPAMAGLSLNLPVIPDPPCGAGSSLTGSAGDTLLTFAGGSLSPGESCTFSVTLDVPVDAAAGGYTNTTSTVSATVGGVTATSRAAFDTLDVAGLVFSKEYVKNPVIPGDSTTLRFTIDNVHPMDDATITFFTDNLSASLSGLAATGGATMDTCGGSLSGTTFLVYSGGSVQSGTSCLIEVEVSVPAGAADGTYSNVTSSLSANQSGGAVTIAPAVDTLEVNSTLLQLTKQFTNDPVAPGDTVTLDLTLTNLDAGEAASSVDFTDDLGAALTGLTFDSLLFNDCGATVSGTGSDTITVDDASLAAGGSCTISVSLTVPGGAAAGSYTNTTSGVTGTIGGLAVVGDAASDDLDIAQLLLFTKSFNGPSAATGTVTLTFTITNPGTGTPTDLAFTDNLDAVIPGLVATSLPASPCGEGSSISGTSFLRFNGGELAPMGGTCSFDVEVLVPASVAPGTFSNTTSNLSQGGLFAAPPATATLMIEPPPVFAKNFAPDTIQAGTASTLTFTVDNSASAVAASILSFVDNLPTGVVIASPANASTTCTGGTLTASSGTSSLSYSGGTVAAGASCTVQLEVTSIQLGAFVNTTGDLTSNSGNSGTATDTLTVFTPPEFSKAFAPGAVVINSNSTLTFTIDNTANVLPASSLDFTDILPAAVVVATPANVSTSCTGGTLTAVSGTSVLSYSGGRIAAGSACTIQVDVVSSTLGSYHNTSGDMTSSLGNSGTASDTLIVVGPPTFNKVFAPNSISTGGISTLTLTIDNSNSALAATSLSVTDNLPASLVVATPSNASTTCLGGTLTAASGSGSITYSGGSVAAGGSCTVTLEVLSTISGNFTNTTGDLTSSLGNSGTAMDTLSVITSLDYGDAPLATDTGFANSYPVTLAQNGARHTAGTLFLGQSVDKEPDGQPDANALGDDNSGDDEDGVVAIASIVATASSATTSSFAVTASSSAVAGGAGKLDAWIDFNQNGIWEHPGERIYNAIDVASGLNILSFIVPAGAKAGSTAARFRLSTAGGLLPTGAASDGEVEDYLFTILDGNAASRASAQINPPVSGELHVEAVGGDVVVRSNSVTLFRAPGTSLARLEINGRSGDDTLNVANLDAIFDGLVAGDAGEGSDLLRLTGAGQSLDFTQIADADIQGLESIDISGAGNNTLKLDVSEVLNLSPTTDTLRLTHDDGDVVSYGSGWVVNLPDIIGSQFVHVLKQTGATIEVANTTAFQNPFLALDVNRDGRVAPIDALIIINRLNDIGPGPLSTPTSVTGLTEYFYYDTNGDRSAAPIDVLQIVNFLNDPSNNTEGEGGLNVSIPYAGPPLLGDDAATTRRQDSSINKTREAEVSLAIASLNSANTSSSAAVAIRRGGKAKLDEFQASLDQLFQSHESSLWNELFE